MTRATIDLWPRLWQLADGAVRKFKLRPKLITLSPFLPHKGLRLDGRCWTRQGAIELRVYRAGRPTQPLARSTIWAILAHELAHLRGVGHPSYGHGPEHGELSRQIADWFRAQGEEVSRILHSGSYLSGVPRTAERASYKRAWKRPKPRRGKR